MTCLLTFVAAWATYDKYPLRHPEGKSSSKPELQSSQLTSSSPHLAAASTALEAFQEIRHLNDLGDSFYTHRFCLQLSKTLSTDELVEILRYCPELEGGDSRIIPVIFAMDLGYRSPSKLINLLNDPMYLQVDNSWIQTLFHYWTMSSPDLAYQAAIKIETSIGSLALRGIYQTGNADYASRVANFLKDNPASEREKRAAITAVENRDWMTNRHEFLNTIANSFKSDPKQGIDLVLGIDDTNMRLQALDQLLQNKWPDPREAVETILQLSEQGHIKNLYKADDYIGAALLSCTDESLPLILGNLHSQLGPDRRANIIQRIQNYAKNFSQQVLQSEFFKSIPDSPIKANFVIACISGQAETDWKASLDMLEEELTPSKREEALSQLVTHAFRQDGPETALQLVESIEGSQAKQIAFTHLADSWGRTDPLSFFSWAAVQSPDSIDHHMLQSTSHAWSQKDLESLREFESNIDSGIVKNALQITIGTKLSETDPIDAIEFAMLVDDRQTSTGIINSAISKWAQSEPKHAVEFVVTAFPEEQATFNNLENIANQWAHSEAPTAARYFNKIKHEGYAYSGLKVVLSQWLDRDPLAAVDFLRTMPAGSRRDKSITTSGVFARALYQDTTLAKSLLQLIDDPVAKKDAQAAFDNHVSPYGAP